MRLAIVMLVIGCGSKAADPAAAPPSSRDAVIETWKAGGLAPGAFAAATLPIGKDCTAGTVGGVDVALCQFATPVEAAASEPAALAWVGDTTGTAFATGSVMVAVADRKKADVHGKVINQLMKLLPAAKK